MTPMNQGLRAVGTVELGGLKNPPSRKRIDYIIKCAKELLPHLGKHEDEWLGFRPTLPDFLPILGPSLKNKNIIYAFGHQHLGWTLGAITGKIISKIVAGEKTNLDLTPYSSKDLIRKFLSKNYLAYTFLTLAALFWSGNFIIGKFATLFEVPPLTLNFLRWVMVWFILIPFTIKEILAKRNYIKENFLVISFMGILTISTFNSVVYFALNYTQVINAVLMLAAIPPMIIIFSSIMKIEKTNMFQISGLILSIFGVGTIISNADIQKIISLTFNIGDIWMLVCVLSWSLYSTLLKKSKLELSQFSLIQIMVTVGLIFLFPQFLYEKSIGLDLKINKAFIFILTYVVIFPAIAAYYCWQKAIELIGPNRSSMFIQLMPLFSAVMAIIIFNEKFELYHFAGAFL